MMRAAFLVALLLVVPLAAAHVPRAEGPTAMSLTAAVDVGDASKSWAFYAELPPGAAHYYAFQAAAGDEVLFSAFTPATSTHAFDVALVGPGLPEDATAAIEVPPGDGVAWVRGVSGETSFEPFTPAAMRTLLAETLVAPSTGTYHLVVVDPTGAGGAYGLAIGARESFTPFEWATIPMQELDIRAWEGQSVLLVVAPIFAGIIAGIVIAQRRGGSVSQFAARAAAGAFVGTALVKAGETVWAATLAPPGAAVLVPIAFILVALALAAWTWRLARGPPDTTRRVMLAAAGILGILAWAGLLIGPALAIIASVVPTTDRRGWARRDQDRPGAT